MQGQGSEADPEEGPRSRMRVRPCAGVEVVFPLLIARTQAIRAKQREHLALSQRTGAPLQSEERATRRGPLIPAFALAAAARALTHPSPNWSGVRVVWIWGVCLVQWIVCKGRHAVLQKLS